MARNIGGRLSPKNKETMVRAADLELPTSVGKYPVSLDRHVCPMLREGLDLPKNVCHQINDSDPVCPDGVLSRWPIGCPAYGPALKLLLKPSYKKPLKAKDEHQALPVLRSNRSFVVALPSPNKNASPLHKQQASGTHAYRLHLILGRSRLAE